LLQETRTTIYINSKITHYLLSYFFWFNTLTGTAKASAVDLLRLNNRYQNHLFNPSKVGRAVLFIWESLPPGIEAENKTPLRAAKISNLAHKTGSRYLLGVLFKISDEHPCPLYMGVPPDFGLTA